MNDSARSDRQPVWKKAARASLPLAAVIGVTFMGGQVSHHPQAAPPASVIALSVENPQQSILMSGSSTVST